jgi:hypothetical protein
MRITTNANIPDSCPRARVNPGNGEPFALIDLSNAGDIVLESLGDCDRLILAAADARRRLEVALRGEKHPYKRDAADNYDGNCDTCGLLPGNDIHHLLNRGQDGSVNGGRQ